MNFRKLNSVNYPFTFFMVQDSDHLSGATGLSPSVQIAKNGASSFSSAAGSVTEMGGGWYKWNPSSADRDTLGECSVLISATGADSFPAKLIIVPWDVFDINLSLQALPAATAGSVGGLPTVDASNGVKLSVGTSSGQVVLNSGLVRADQVSGAVGSISGVTFPNNFDEIQVVDGFVYADVQQVAGTTATPNNSVDANIISINGNSFSGSAMPSILADGSITAGKFATGAIDATSFAQNAADRIWASSSRSLTETELTIGTVDANIISVNGTTFDGESIPSILAEDGLDNIAIEDDVNMRQALGVIGAVLAGKATNSGSTQVFYAAMGNPETNRVSAVVNAGSRSVVTLNLAS